MQVISLVIGITIPEIIVKISGHTLFYYLEKAGTTTIIKILENGILERTGGSLI
jgi:hypothetical protein